MSYNPLKDDNLVPGNSLYYDYLVKAVGVKEADRIWWSRVHELRFENGDLEKINAWSEKILGKNWEGYKEVDAREYYAKHYF